MAPSESRLCEEKKRMSGLIDDTVLNASEPDIMGEPPIEEPPIQCVFIPASIRDIAVTRLFVNTVTDLSCDRCGTRKLDVLELSSSTVCPFSSRVAAFFAIILFSVVFFVILSCRLATPLTESGSITPPCERATSPRFCIDVRSRRMLDGDVIKSRESSFTDIYVRFLIISSICS